MPGGDETGPMGEGQGMGGRGGTGSGRGRMGGMGLGAGGTCVCLKCGRTIPHQRGIPCTQMQCPACGTRMTRQQ